MSDFNPQAQAMTTQNAPAAPTVPHEVSPGVFETGFQDSTVKQYEFELYNGRTGVTDRIYLLRSKSLIKARRHYHEAKLKFVLCNSVYKVQGQQEIQTHEAQCCKRLGSNSLVFAALVVRYVTDRNGTVIIPFVTPELRMWRFGVDKYLNLKSIDEAWGLDKHDIKVLCTEDKYQKLTIGALPDCVYLHPNFPTELKQQFEAWADAARPKVARELGKRMTDDEILAALGQAGAATPQMLPADQPIGDLQFSNMLGGPAGTAKP